MASYLPNPGQNSFAPAPVGSHVAICCRVVDLGTQEVNYQGQLSKKRQILVTWELQSEERMTDGRPFTVGKKYTWSMHEKSGLRRDLQTWRGVAFKETDFGPGGFDIRKIVGQPCLISITHKEKPDGVRSEVAGVMKLPKGTHVEPIVNPPTFVWLDKDDFSPPDFDRLSDKLKATVMQSPEYRAMKSGSSVTTEMLDAGHDPVDDLPF
jgi:hypothetical protein